MRLREVVVPYLSKAGRVLDACQGDIVVRAFVNAAEHVAFHSVDLDDASKTLTSKDILVRTVVQSASDDGQLMAISSVARLLPHGGVAVLLLKDDIDELPLDAISGVVKAVGRDLLEVAPLSYEAWPTALVVGYAVHRPKDSGVTLWRPQSSRRSSEITTKAISEEAGTYRQHRFEVQLRERRRKIANLERQLAVLRNSTTLALGGEFVRIARRPLTALLLPVRVFRIWKNWKNPDTTAAKVSSEPVQNTVTEQHQGPSVNEEFRLLNGLDAAGTSPGQIRIHSIVSDGAAIALADHASLTRLLPHTAKLTLEHYAADAVLIQASALLAPSPWGHAGTPGGAVSLTRALHNAFDAAKARSIPVVVWQDVAMSRVPALGPILRNADLVCRSGDVAGTGFLWSPGVPLRHFQPIEKSVTERTLIVGDRFRSALSFREAEIRESLLKAGLASIGTPWFADIPELIRTHAFMLAEPLTGGRTRLAGDLTLAAIASGARVLSGANDCLLGDYPSAVLPIGDGTGIVDTVREAISLDGLSIPQRLRQFRLVFERDATPVRLSQLSSELGIPRSPLAARHFDVLLRIGNGDDLGFALDGVLSQSIKPQHLWLAADLVPDRALDEVSALGISSTVIPLDEPLHRTASRSASPWVTLWTADGISPPEHLLADLSAAAEASRADVVGSGSELSSNWYGRYVDSLPTNRALIKRDQVKKFEKSLDMRTLIGRGASLFAVNQAGAAE